MKNNIPVFFACDDKYAMPMAVALTSIVANTKSFVNFYVLDNKISQKAKDGVEELKKTFDNFSIEFIPVDMSLFNNFPSVSWYSLNIYTRFLIPEIKKDIDRAIYFDSDMVFNSNIQEIFDMDLDGYILGAAAGEAEITSRDKFQKHMNDLGLLSSHTYFGSGFLMFDCKKWRREKITEKIFSTMDSIKNIVELPDQDVLNVVFNDNYKVFDVKYNREIDCLKEEYKFNKNLLRNVPLIQYDGPRKPWKIRNMFLAEYFWKYAKMTPFFEELWNNSLFEATKIFQASLFGKIPFLDVYSKKYLFCKMFKFITLFKVKTNNDKAKVYLFGFIYILKIKRF